MKLSYSKKSEPIFPPVSLTIVFESQYELDFLAALFNISTIVTTGDKIGNMDLSAIRECLKIIGADSHLYFDAINKALTK